MNDLREVVEVQGRKVKLSSLAKALYPDGFTKGEVVDYYVNVSAAMLPHLADRPATFIRYPEGTGKDGFFAKHAPSHRPDWVRAAEVASRKSDKSVEYVVIEDLPTLMWAANLDAIEFHTPPWRLVDRQHPDSLVIDLDPGAPATVVECARVAELAAEVLRTNGMSPSVVTSGSKGLHLVAPLDGATGEQAAELAQAIAVHLESQHPDLVVARMALAARPGKVFVDWSQASGKKTNITPYSLRGTPSPSVSTPVTWDEVADAREPGDLRFTPEQVVERVRTLGDLLAIG